MAGIGQVQLNNSKYDLLAPEYIAGTMTGVTNAWTGVTTSESLYDGKTIVFSVNYANTAWSNVTLDLTLAGGTTTGAKAVYRYGTTRVTGQFNNIPAKVILTYDSSKDGWFVNAAYDTDTIGAVRSDNSGITTATQWGRYVLAAYKNETTILPVNAVDNSTATTKTLTTDSFNIFQNIIYRNANSAIAASTVVPAYTMYQQMNSVIDLRYSFNTGTTLTANKAVYIVCVPQSDGLVKLASTPISQTLPTTTDEKYYKYIGQAYDTYRISFVITQPVYEYKNGKICIVTNQSGSVVPTDFVSGHITLADAASHNHSVTLPLITLGTSSTSVSVSGSFTPAGTVTALSPTYTKTTITGATTTSEVNKIGYSDTNATVTGASYTPAGTITITNTETAVTETSHSHGVGTLAGTVGTAVTLTSYSTTATGRIQYMYGASWTANTPTAVTLPTFSAATYSSVMYDPVYTSSTKTLAFSIQTVKGGTFTAGTVTAGTAAAFTASKSYVGAAISNSAVTITGSTDSTATGIKYSKATAASFSGTAATISPTVKYSKAVSIYYSRATGGTGTFSGTAGTVNATGNVDIPNSATYSSSNSTKVLTTTSTVGGAKTSTYTVLNPSNATAGVYPSVS